MANQAVEIRNLTKSFGGRRALDDVSLTVGEGEMVALTLRVNREQWRRLHELALAEGLSLNQLALQGLTEIFVKRGLKPL